MGSPLDKLASQYAKRYGKTVRSRDKLRELYGRYVRRREETLLEAAAATAAIDAIFYANELDFDAITPQMREAFTRAYPGHALVEELEGWRGLGENQIQGHLNHWKGTYHEVLIHDRLNEGQQVGSVVLGEGQRAVLPESLNQPGYDLQILNADGSVDSVLQAKATEEVGIIREALEKYPDIGIVATQESAADIVDERVFPSGFSDQDLEAKRVSKKDDAR